MRVYADTSFLVKAITHEVGTEAVISEYRRLGLPQLFYTPFHALEVGNAIRQRYFHQKRVLPSGERAHIIREKNAALSRLEQQIKRGLLLEVTADWEKVLSRARALSEKYAETTGARTLDILHVAFAIELRSEIFLTTDKLQSEVAKAEHLQTVLPSS